jgi:TatD DNase family protein
MITFKKYEAAELLRSVPLDRLLVETDSPYLAPVPHRGKRNEPAFVQFVAARAAELRGEDATALSEAVTRNARAFFRLDA